MAGNKKYYVVWEGRISGVYDSWAACKEQIDQFQGAKYKGFESKMEADKAFHDGYAQYYKKNPVARKSQLILPGSDGSGPILNSLSVDAAWNTVSKVMEYQGVYTATKELIFRKGPYAGASNNIGEFLALVHGLALLKKQNSPVPIYSDSITAIAWVREKKHKSVILPTRENEEIFEMLQRAELWLINNTFTTKILKWNTKVWGEIPADFGRK
ncbi:ribonuclease H family protein [Bacteroidales bacterium OttesenSCG-928-C03]|nr:ribonuclease H family protein [Bacteroidales bacterium OttesenSCG-928-E04]MDL2308682.1 ribonuclease H family protein [Bacteroidales bacterium OttesenSCG-928-C03]MDL2325954.1 ribonuclease H family protein [Bacteroidales bacterium OttesenSCG-928-A14]